MAWENWGADSRAKLVHRPEGHRATNPGTFGLLEQEAA